MVRIAHLGATGSFTEEAALAWLSKGAGHAAPTLLGRADPRAVVALVEEDLADYGILPVANSRGGLVRAALEALTAGACLPCDELVLPVRFSLWTRRPELAAADLTTVASHPQAFRQCTRSLARLLPRRQWLERSDTASAARDLAGGALGAEVAVLASRRAGKHYGLHPLADDVHDDPDNRTFFLLFQSRHPRLQQP